MTSIFGNPTTNWVKQVCEVTHDGSYSVPHIASQFMDGKNAIRVHCGAEMHVQVKLEFYLTNDDDIAALDQFLNHFGLPRNGYQIVDTRQPYSSAASYTSSPYEAGTPAIPVLPPPR